MKEPEISRTAVSDAKEPPAVSRPRSFPPATISLSLARIAGQIPEAARLPGFDERRLVEFPCAEVLAAPSPKLRLSRLAEVAPEFVRRGMLPDVWIRLPAGPLAISYCFSEKKVLQESDFGSRERCVGDPSRATNDAKPEMSNFATPESRKSALPSVKGENAEAASPASAALLPGEERSVSSVPADAGGSGSGFSRDPQLPAQGEAFPGPASLGATIPPAESANGGAPVSRSANGVVHGFFPGELPKAVAPLEVSSSSSPSRQDSGAPANDAPGSWQRQPSTREAVLVEVEHLSREGAGCAAEIPNQDALQAVFLTEDFLSLERVVELCGGLPGITSCILAHGSAVLAAHNVPESIDLLSLSAHALDLLAAIRQSSSLMGVGAVPAVTIHSEKGPITFFHRDDLCLLVLHRDRGFVPGVREKLQLVVEHLSEANLALPVGVSRPALVRREMVE